MKGPSAADRAYAAALAASIPDGALASALAVGTARAAAQNQTLGNIRARTASLLPTSAVSVTFATSVGWLANNPTADGGIRMPTWVTIALLGFVIAIGVVTMIVQWPVVWSFDSGTEVYRDAADEAAAQRAAIAKLELVVAKNHARLGFLFTVFEIGVVLLAIETVLVVIGLFLGQT